MKIYLEFCFYIGINEIKNVFTILLLFINYNIPLYSIILQKYNYTKIMFKSLLINISYINHYKINIKTEKN